MATVAQPDVEPPSGLQGKGTADEPFDQGNAPEQAAGPGIEPPSGLQGAGTVEQPYDQGNQPEQPKATSQPSTDDPLASPSTTHQGSGNPMSEPTKAQEQIIHDTRGRDETEQTATAAGSGPRKTSTGTAAKGGNFDAARAGAGQEASRLRYEDRDVSPGEMKDGSHAITSGKRGQSYTPSKFNKVKDKFHFGKH